MSGYNENCSGNDLFPVNVSEEYAVPNPSSLNTSSSCFHVSCSTNTEGDLCMRFSTKPPLAVHPYLPRLPLAKLATPLYALQSNLGSVGTGRHTVLVGATGVSETPRSHLSSPYFFLSKLFSSILQTFFTSSLYLTLDKINTIPFQHTHS